MLADRDSAAHAGAGVGKPPGKEPARDGCQSGRECYGDLWLALPVSVKRCDRVVRRSPLLEGLISMVARRGEMRRPMARPISTYEEGPGSDSLTGERHGRVAARPFDPVVLDLERDAIGIGCDQAAVGNGDATGVNAIGMSTRA